MKKSAEKTEASRQYAAAHEAHYKTKDLGQALGLYRVVLDAHPETEEAKYSQSQIQNIVSAVVPKQELFDAQVELALVHVVAHGSFPGNAPKPVAPGVANSPGGIV
ncbi:MAG: hypothetical protein R6V85_18625 [Polyangia bacterium]